jgi:hypothetical protein
VPTKRDFDLFLVMFILVVPAKGLIKMWAHRKAAANAGMVSTVAQAAEVVL